MQTSLMSLFKKVFIVVFISHVAYWLIAALGFGVGQLLFQTATAIVAGIFFTTRLLKGRGKLVWLMPLVWIVLAMGCYQYISVFAILMNRSLYRMPLTQLWNAVRVFDMALASLVIAIAVTIGIKLLGHKARPTMPSRSQ